MMLRGAETKQSPRARQEAKARLSKRLVALTAMRHWSRFNSTSASAMTRSGVTIVQTLLLDTCLPR